MPRPYKGSFNAGEVDPGLFGRVDLDRHRSALKLCRNAIPLPQGGVAKRPGSQYVGPAFGTYQGNGPTWEPEFSRLIPFEFNNEQTYMLIVTPTAMRVIKNGGFVLFPMDQPDPNSAAIAGSPVISSSGIVTWTSHTYVVGDIVYWNTGGYREFEGRYMIVTSVTATTFTLKSYPGETSLTGGTASASGYDFGKLYERTSTAVGGDDGWYASGDAIDIDEIDFTQANDTLYVAHPNALPKVVTRTADDDWTITDFNPAPAVASPSGLQEEGTKPAGTKSVWYAVTAVDPDTYEESLASELEVTSTDDPTGASPIIIEWDGQDAAGTIGDIVQFNIYRGVNGIYGLVGTAMDTTPGGGATPVVQFNDTGYVPNLSIAPPLNADYFQAAGEYPGAVELFQQRVWFGRSDNLLQDVYASRAGSVRSFASSTVSTDDDPISQLIQAKSVQEVRYFIPLRDMIVMTSDGEWGFDTGDLGYLTPGSGMINHSYWGCAAGVKPAIVGNSAVFVDKTGSAVRDAFFDASVDGIASTELSILAKHLFKQRSVKRIAYCSEPYDVLFVLFNDGGLVSCTYVRDQQIFAWARHDFGGRVVDLASVTEDTLNNLYITIFRSADVVSGISDALLVERIVMYAPSYPEQGVYLDSSVEQPLPSSSNYDDTIWAIVRSGNDIHIRTNGLAGSLHGYVAQIAFADDSQLASLTNATFYLTSVGTNVYKLSRGAGAVTALDARKLPSIFVSEATGAYPKRGWLKLGTAAVSGLYHLQTLHSSNEPVVRVGIAGELNLSDTDVAFGFSDVWGYVASCVGLKYYVQIETLDIDDPNNPITGLPMTLGDVLIRMTLGQSIRLGRSSDELVDYSDLSAFVSAWDETKQSCVGVIEPIPFPGWSRNGRVFVENYDAYPFEIASIAPQIEVGDIDV